MSNKNEIEILLVEDNVDDMEMTLRALRKTNVVNSIKVARDGAEALDFIFGEGSPVAQKVESVPKLILMDLKLPKVNGLEVLQRVKSDPRTKRIPIVILSSSMEQQDVVESYQLGVNSYVVKPVNFESFIEAVGKLGLYWLALNQPPS